VAEQPHSGGRIGPRQTKLLSKGRTTPCPQVTKGEVQNHSGRAPATQQRMPPGLGDGSPPYAGEGSH
jgi:hypothetical protein